MKYDGGIGHNIDLGGGKRLLMMLIGVNFVKLRVGLNNLSHPIVARGIHS